MTIRTKLAVAATAAAAAVLPFQVGVAHASTPEDDLNACISNAVAIMGDNVSDNIDACVNAYLAELGIDTSTLTVDTTATTPTVTTDDGGDGSVNTGILGTVDSDSSTGTPDAGAS